MLFIAIYFVQIYSLSFCGLNALYGSGNRCNGYLCLNLAR